MAIGNKTLRGDRHSSTPTNGASPAGAGTLMCRTRYLDDLSAGQAGGQWLVQERHSANTPLVTYTRRPDLSGTLDGAGGIGGLLARSRHATSSPYAVNGSSFYHADGNGNETYLANSSGRTDAAYRYDPFGRWLAQTGPYASANGMRFSSKPWVGHNGSNSDGLYYYGYRFYDPLTQRWLNRDPLEEQGGVNLYGFVMNNPIGIMDAHGLVSVPMPPNPSANACCEAILEFLKQLTRHVRARYNDLLADKMFLFKYDPVGWKNHIKKFEEQRDRLKEWIEKFKKKCPGGNGGQPVPVWILVEADREAPIKPLWAERTRHWSEYVPGTPQQIETVGVVSGFVGDVILVGTGVGAGTAVIIRGGSIIRIGGKVGLVPVY